MRFSGRVREGAFDTKPPSCKTLTSIVVFGEGAGGSFWHKSCPLAKMHCRLLQLREAADTDGAVPLEQKKGEQKHKRGNA